MTRTLENIPPVPLDDVQHFVMEDASWEFYENLLREIGDRPIRVTYDKGRMEITSPLPEHERPKTVLGRMIETLTLELDLPMVSFGSTTFRKKSAGQGLEPDECYYFKNESKMRDRKRVDLKKDPPPELVVEIDITSRSIARQPIYAALGVREIWRYDGDRVECLHLFGTRYRVCKMSLAFDFLEPARLQKFLDLQPSISETAILRKFIGWIRENGWK